MSPLTLCVEDPALVTPITALWCAAARPAAVHASTPFSVQAVTDMVDTGATSWDVCNADALSCTRLGRAGLLELIDWTIVDQRAAPKPWLVPWFGVPAYLYSTVVAFDRSVLGGQSPSGWTDFWDPARWPGKRILPTASATGICEAALLGAGVPPTALYPLDLNRALAILTRLRPHVILAPSESAAASALASGAGSLALLRNTTAHLLREQTAGRIDFSWGQAIVAPSLLMVPKQPPAGRAAAMRMLAAAQRPALQRALLSLAGCGPVNPAARAALTAEQAQFDPAAAHRAAGISIDLDWYDRNFEALQPRWANFLAA